MTLAHIEAVHAAFSAPSSWRWEALEFWYRLHPLSIAALEGVSVNKIEACGGRYSDKWNRFLDPYEMWLYDHSFAEQKRAIASAWFKLLRSQYEPDRRLALWNTWRVVVLLGRELVLDYLTINEFSCHETLEAMRLPPEHVGRGLFATLSCE